MSQRHSAQFEHASAARSPVIFVKKISTRASTMPLTESTQRLVDFVADVPRLNLTLQAVPDGFGAGNDFEQYAQVASPHNARTTLFSHVPCLLALSFRFLLCLSPPACFAFVSFPSLLQALGMSALPFAVVIALIVLCCPCFCYALHTRSDKKAAAVTKKLCSGTLCVAFLLIVVGCVVGFFTNAALHRNTDAVLTIVNNTAGQFSRDVNALVSNLKAFNATVFDQYNTLIDDTVAEVDRTMGQVHVVLDGARRRSHLLRSVFVQTLKPTNRTGSWAPTAR